MGRHLSGRFPLTGAGKKSTTFEPFYTLSDLEGAFPGLTLLLVLVNYVIILNFFRREILEFVHFKRCKRG